MCVDTQRRACCRGCRVGKEWGSVCAAHSRTSSHPGDTRAAAKPTELNPGFCKPFKFLSLRPWKTPASIHLLIQLLFPRVTRQLERLSEAITCTLAQRCSPKGTWRVLVPWGARMVALPTQPQDRDHFCLPQMHSVPSFILGWAWAGIPLRSASNHRAVLNKRLLTSEPVQVKGGQGRVHENFPPSGKMLLIEQIWLLAASS